MFNNSNINWNNGHIIFISLEKQSMVQISVRIYNFCHVHNEFATNELNKYMWATKQTTLVTLTHVQFLMNSLQDKYMYTEVFQFTIWNLNHCKTIINEFSLCVYLSLIYRSQILSHMKLLPLNQFQTAIFHIFGQNVCVFSIPSIALWMRVTWMICGILWESRWQQ